MYAKLLMSFQKYNNKYIVTNKNCEDLPSVC